MFGIEEFWIINATGAPEYWYSPFKKLDPDIEHPFITKICERVKNLYKNFEIIREEELNMLEIKGHYYYYLGSPILNSILIAKSLKKFEPFRIYFELCQVEKAFRPFFAKAIQKLEQDDANGVKIFDDLKEKYDNSFFKEYFKNHLK
jgi:hypothetical protein